MSHDGRVSSVMPSDCRLVMAHGAGSESTFLAEAFPATSAGVADTRYVDDRTGRLGPVMTALAAAATTDLPTILGGVSLGAHGAARLLSRPDLPGHIVAGLLVMPAWTGPPDRVADMTGAAAQAVDVLGPDGVLAELDPDDWVTSLLTRAWGKRSADALVSELRTAADQPGPTDDQLSAITVPVVLVALRDDPLHPVQVAQHWAELIPRAHVVKLGREEPADDLTVFGRAAADGLRELL